VGDSWPDWKIWCELARRLDLGQYFPWQTDEEIVEALLPPGEYKDSLKAASLGAYYGQKEYDIQKRKKLNTPSGKIELYSQTLKDYGYDPIPEYLEPYQSPASTPDLAKKYPLILISGSRTQEYTHTQLRYVPVLRQSNPEPLAEMHPATAEQYALKNGSMVQVETKSGGMKLRLYTSDKVAPGVVSVPHGWAQANVNLLVDMEGLDPITAEEIDDLIIDINRRTDTTMIIVTHELASIFAVARRVIMLDKTSKKIIAEGTPRDLKDSSPNPLVRRFFRRYDRTEQKTESNTT